MPIYSDINNNDENRWLYELPSQHEKEAVKSRLTFQNIFRK